MMQTVTAFLLDGKEDNPVEQFAASYSGPEVLVQPDSFLQSGFWTSFKVAHGWRRIAAALKITTEERQYVLPLYLLVRSFKRIFSLAYVPLAPQLSIVTEAAPSMLLQQAAYALRSFLPGNTICIRFDPPEYTAHQAESQAVFPQLYSGIKRASSDVQPPDSVLLDLTQSTDDILAGMKPKWRYNIRLGEKKGVTVSCTTGDAAAAQIDTFYALYGETSARDGIAVHAKSYYLDLLNRGTIADAEVRLYMAHHENDILAAIITLFCRTAAGNREAVYLYGASSNTKRNLMPAYSLQWRALQDAKAAGCIRYDFYGIPPINDEHHPMYGLYRFKTGFGGNVIHRSGSLDVPLAPFQYCLYRCMETFRALWFKRIKKLVVGR